MRVGLVRSVALGVVALVGFAGCDDNPTDFDRSDTTAIRTNPSAMTINGASTALVDSRTINAGDEPTWEEISATVDGSCGHSDLSVATAAAYEPSVQPPGQFDVTAGTTVGESCIGLSGGGASATVEVTVVGDSLAITGAQDTLNLNASLQLGAMLLAADGSVMAPFDAATDVTWESDDTDVMTVDAAGLVTAVGVGTAVITGTWTSFGVSRSSEITISTNQPTLNITNAPETMIIFETVDLDAELINPTDPPADFGPFDQNTDVEWESSDTDVITVDAMTGEADAVGAGTATITATWTGNDDIFDEASITVQVPAPVLISSDVATADMFDPIELTGTGFIDGGHSIFVDGGKVPSGLNPTIVDPTTATFEMCAGALGDVEVQAGTPADLSNALTIERTSEMVEPDSPFAPNPICGTSLTIENASLDHDTDTNDWFLVEVESATNILIQLTWPDASQDLDILVTDGAFTAYVCTDGATANPGSETSSCSLPSAGTYLIWIDHFAPAGVSTGYTLTVD